MSWFSTLLVRANNPEASTAPTRAVDTNYTPSSTKYVQARYNLELVCTAGQTVTVDLRSDTSTPPTTVRDSAKLAADAGLGGPVTIRTTVAYLVPPGHNIRLSKTGTGTVTVIGSLETPVS